MPGPTEVIVGLLAAERRAAFEAALGALADHGLLLLSDAALPSITAIVVGEPLRGSWWGHPQGGVIYHVSTALEDHPDVLTTKLVAGKVTFVHRRLWPAVVAVATSREPWQLAGLTPAAHLLLTQTATQGEVQTNDLAPLPGLQRKDMPRAARELERRLLVCATEIHTPTGAHARVLETWQHWAARTGFTMNPPPVSDARRDLEDAVKGLTPGPATKVAWLLPWPMLGRGAGERRRGPSAAPPGCRRTPAVDSRQS